MYQMCIMHMVKIKKMTNCAADGNCLHYLPYSYRHQGKVFYIEPDLPIDYCTTIYNFFFSFLFRNFLHTYNHIGFSVLPGLPGLHYSASPLLSPEEEGFHTINRR